MHFSSDQEKNVAVGRRFLSLRGLRPATEGGAGIVRPGYFCLFPSSAPSHPAERHDPPATASLPHGIFAAIHRLTLIAALGVNHAGAQRPVMYGDGIFYYLAAGAALFGLLPAVLAWRKRRSFALWWFYGTLLLPVAVAHAVLLRPAAAGDEARGKDASTMRCPACDEILPARAVGCRKCGWTRPAESAKERKPKAQRVEPKMERAEPKMQRSEPTGPEKTSSPDPDKSPPGESGGSADPAWKDDEAFARISQMGPSPTERTRQPTRLAAAAAVLAAFLLLGGVSLGAYFWWSGDRDDAAVAEANPPRASEPRTPQPAPQDPPPVAAPPSSTGPTMPQDPPPPPPNEPRTPSPAPPRGGAAGEPGDGAVTMSSAAPEMEATRLTPPPPPATKPPVPEPAPAAKPRTPSAVAPARQASATPGPAARPNAGASGAATGGAKDDGATPGSVTAVGDLVTWLQRRLAALGHFDGPINGRADARTRAAIRSWQTAHQMTPSGRIDQALIVSLRRADAARDAARN